jgi:hypothetical protein
LAFRKARPRARPTGMNTAMFIITSGSHNGCLCAKSL